MFKCNLNANKNTADEKTFRLYQFFFLSILLYRDLWKNVTSGFNDKVDYNFESVKWHAVLGLPELELLTPDEIKKTKKVAENQSKIYSLLMKKYREFEAEPPVVPENLKANVELLAKTFGLNEAEKSILIFLCIVKLNQFNCLDLFNIFKNKKSELITYREFICNFLATVSDCGYEALYKALSRNGALVQNRLISVNEEPRDFEYYLDFEGDLAAKLVYPNQKLQDLLERSLVKGKESSLDLEDFSYLSPDLPLLVEYLLSARQSQKQGVNVLLYGPPGTGKSELSRTIARHIGADLYEVPVMDADGEAVRDRMNSLMFNLSQLKNNPEAVLVFDEAQDLFKNYGSPAFFAMNAAPSNAAKGNKGLTNKLLESNQTPVIWITNSIHAMDPAYIRRFDFCLNVPVPPEAQRRKIIENKAGAFLLPEGIHCIAKRSDIAPAVIDRTAKVLSTIAAPKEELQKHFFTHLNATLDTMGIRPVLLQKKLDPADLYDPQLSTADYDLNEIAKGVAQAQNARICLYGVPGTGKTAWAHYLGRVLGKQVIVKRSSDLLNCYVGMTERNIALAFEEAKSESAILVIDEADSFLQKRGNADHSWEITQVNEMLTQIENFEGIFVATTNALNAMDDACLRRFDLKVKFDYLDAEKAKTLFRRYCEKICPESTIDENVLEAVGNLRSLTPGDFATLTHQSRFNPIKTPEALLKGLEKECSTKEGHSRKRPIGFN